MGIRGGAGGTGSKMLFPLRTGVELFADPGMPEAGARAKQAAVLYDEVVFETGLYEVSIAETGTRTVGGIRRRS